MRTDSGQSRIDLLLRAAARNSSRKSLKAEQCESTFDGASCIWGSLLATTSLHGPEPPFRCVEGGLGGDRVPISINAPSRYEVQSEMHCRPLPSSQRMDQRENGALGFALYSRWSVSQGEGH